KVRFLEVFLADAELLGILPVKDLLNLLIEHHLTPGGVRVLNLSPSPTVAVWLLNDLAGLGEVLPDLVGSLVVADEIQDPNPVLPRAQTQPTPELLHEDCLRLGWPEEEQHSDVRKIHPFVEEIDRERDLNLVPSEISHER